MKVIAESIVAKMLQPAAHHGICWPPRKKSSVSFIRFMKNRPTATMPSRYATSTP